ncbi:hypothetical protein CKCBHOJB_01393 [Thauera sp. GDN1]|uniref:NYN domain-containing protein n=1 Tax=Thauera sp. GDN1 TaxID=2944810 RepID=UPI00247AF066|nr:NYN domain-containing protein [Thauera sp. GDN1]WEN41817.1 hypothetical protein CKCBHOJB_01393 [Thauera sp. GDN1]
MASSSDSVSMALFCDFENVALGVRDAKYEKFDIKRVLERLLLKGSIVVKKAYCDWERYKSFKAAMHEANFELIEIPHVRQSGKNSADIRLVVDALDLCYTKSHVDTFVIISGDSDFSPLVSKLRENAKQVIGVGVKQSTSDLLIANCDEFIFYDDLVRDSQRAAAKREARDNPPAVKRSTEEDKARREELEARRGKAIDIAVETFEALLAERGESGKIWSSMLKEAIKRRKPDFNESYFGFRAFGNLLEEAQSRGLLELGRDEKSGTYVTRPAPGTMVSEPVVVVREVASVEPAAVSVQANEPVEAEPAVRTGREGGRGSRRRGARAAEAGVPAEEAAHAAAMLEQVAEAAEAEASAHAASATESVTVESSAMPQPEPGGAGGQAGKPSKSGRSRGRRAAAKGEAELTPVHVEATQEPSVPESTPPTTSETAQAEQGDATRAGRGAARPARKRTQPAEHAAGTAVEATAAAETRGGGAGRAAKPAKRGRGASAEAAPAAVVAAVEGGAPATADAQHGEPARKAAPRTRRPRKPKAESAE